MISFSKAWLPLCACTLNALFYKALTGYLSMVSHLAILALGFVSLILWGIYWMVLYPSYFTPFRHLPTPPKRTALTGNRQVFFPEYPWEDIRRISETLPNNGLIRFYESLSREVLLVTKPQALRDMLSLKHFDFGHPSLIKNMMQRLTGSKLDFLSPDGHKLFRKNLRPAFTTTHVKEFTPMFWDKSVEMVQLIEAELEVNSDSVINLREYAYRATLDNIGLAMMGYDFQTLQYPDNELRRRFSKVVPQTPKAFNWIGLLSYYIDLRPALMLLSPLMKKSEVRESSNYIRSFAKRVVQERQEKLRNSEFPKTKDITTVALASGAFPLDELLDHIMLFLTAGHETITTAFEWTMYELGRRPEMQRRMRTEIKDALGPASTGIVELGSRVQKLPYLSAFCNEIIRCYPLIPLTIKVAEKNTAIVGEHIPEGTVILFAAEAFNHDKELWGPDAHIFNPDRWLEAGMANSGGASSSYAMLSFGAGPLSCIGQNFARAELACLVAAVVRRFEINLVNAETAGRSKLGPFKRSKEGIYARLKIVESL